MVRLAILLSLAACSSTPKTQTLNLSLEEEQRLTRQVLPQIQRLYPAVQNAELQSRVSTVGKNLVQALGTTPYQYSFTVVQSPTVNAFALPAGRIFITASLLAQMQSEDELAGVLAHEMAHVEAQHSSQRIHKLRQTRENSWWYGTGGAVVGGLAGGAVASSLCPRSSCGDQLIGSGIAGGIAGGLLIQKYQFLQNTQENELHADRYGFALAVRAGYDPEHVGDFFLKLSQQSIDFLSTHPSNEQRLQQLQGLRAQTGSVHPL